MIVDIDCKNGLLVDIDCKNGLLDGCRHRL